MSGSRNSLLGDWFQSPSATDGPTSGLLAPNPLYNGAPTWADAAQWHGQNLLDTAAAMRDPRTWQDAAQQYGNALLMGTTAPGVRVPIYRGQMRGTEPSGNFFSEDLDFAKQFTRSGLDEEVIRRHIDPAAIYQPPKAVYAGDEAAVDAAIAEARRLGKSAVRLSEAKGKEPGEGEPASLFVFDKGALRRR